MFFVLLLRELLLSRGNMVNDSGKRKSISCASNNKVSTLQCTPIISGSGTSHRSINDSCSLHPLISLPLLPRLHTFWLQTMILWLLTWFLPVCTCLYYLLPFVSELKPGITCHGVSRFQTIAPHLDTHNNIKRSGTTTQTWREHSKVSSYQANWLVPLQSPDRAFASTCLTCLPPLSASVLPWLRLHDLPATVSVWLACHRINSPRS